LTLFSSFLSFFQHLSAPHFQQDRHFVSNSQQFFKWHHDKLTIKKRKLCFCYPFHSHARTQNILTWPVKENKREFEGIETKAYVSDGGGSCVRDN
jgi:hypothetical protein